MFLSLQAIFLRSERTKKNNEKQEAASNQTFKMKKNLTFLPLKPNNYHIIHATLYL